MILPPSINVAVAAVAVAVTCLSGTAAYVSYRWYADEREARVAAEARADQIEASLAIADRVRDQIEETQRSTDAALTEAWREAPDEADAPVDPALLRAIECVRTPALCFPPR